MRTARKERNRKNTPDFELRRLSSLLFLVGARELVSRLGWVFFGTADDALLAATGGGLVAPVSPELQPAKMTADPSNPNTTGQRENMHSRRINTVTTFRPKDSDSSPKSERGPSKSTPCLNSAFN